MTTPKQSPTLTSRWYDRLKFVSLILLPAFATLYFALGQIWGLPKVEEVVGTTTAVDTFFGFLLRGSNKNYYKNEQNFDGEVLVQPDDGGSKATVLWNEHPLDLVDDQGKHSLELKVVREGEPPQ